MKKRIRKYLRDARTRSFWRRFISMIACIVVFCTTYALLLPAITMEKTAACGFEEHQHVEECFEEKLTCGLEEGGEHTHTADCYTVEKHLVCKENEHVHNEDCYDPEGRLTCALEEHSHNGGCYEMDRILSCGQEETKGHTHTAACYEKILTCGKQVHSHSPACYKQETAESGREESAESRETDRGREDGPSEDDPSENRTTGRGREESAESQTTDSGRKDDPSESRELGEKAGLETAGNETAEFLYAEEERQGEAGQEIALPDFLTPETSVWFRPLEADDYGWNRVDGRAEILQTDDIRLYYQYTIPAGTLDPDHPETRLSLPENITLTDNQIEFINTAGDDRGAQVINGTRLPNAAPQDEETVAAWFRIENHIDENENTDGMDNAGKTDFTDGMDSAGISDFDIPAAENGSAFGEPANDSKTAFGEPATDNETTFAGSATDDEPAFDGPAGDIVLTFDDSVIEENRDHYEDGHLARAGRDVSGFFSIDLSVDQIRFEKDTKEARILLVPSDAAAGTEENSAVLAMINENGDNGTEGAEESDPEGDTFQETDDFKEAEDFRETDNFQKADDFREADNFQETEDSQEEDTFQEDIVAEEQTESAEEEHADTGDETVTEEDQAEPGDEAAPEADQTETSQADRIEQDQAETSFSTLTFEGDDYTVTATFDQSAGIPADAALSVKEITQKEKDYKNYREQAEQAVGGNPEETVAWVRLFDISIVKDGQVVEPSGPVSVQINYHEAMERASNADVKTVHFEGEKETPRILNTETEGTATAVEQVSFDTESFSVFAIVGTVIEKNVLASDGKNYRITATYGTETGIPEEAELEVKEILPEEQGDAIASSVYGMSYKEYVAYTENVLGMEEGSTGYIRLFDIKIVDKDDHSVKYQPKEGTVVDVRIELADAEDGKDLSVVHFADGSEEGDVVESSTESAENGQAVTFAAESFSVYGIVELDPAETATSVDELDGNSYFVSLLDGNNQYYYADPLVLVSNAWKFQRATALDSATRFYFEAAAEPDEQDNRFYIYLLDEEGNRKYVNLHIENTNLRYFEFGDSEETATRYTVEIHTEGSPDTFLIYHKEGVKEFYYWNRNGNYFELAKTTNAAVPKNNNDKIILTQIGSDDSTPSDPYGIDGQSLGILWNVNDTSGSAMMSTSGTANSQITPSDGSAKVTESINVLKNKSTTVKIDPISRTDRVFVAQNSDISMWTFTCCGPAEYYITTVVNGQLKYVRFDESQTVGNGDKGISLVDTPDERCRITITEGTGSYSGKYKFSSNGRTLYNNNGNFFTKADTQNDQYVFMYFAEQSNLNDDDFVVYTAKKVSVSGPVNEDGTIDYEVKDGEQIVLYTRIWNDKTLEYEYYAIDYDGMLVRAYMSGDNISWVGSKVNTMLWDFTEYHTIDADGNETEEPNYYYELQNSYSGKYMAPQVSGEGFLSDSPIGINLNGRRYNEYYSTILAWDTPYYDYAMLMVPEKKYQLDAAPIALANDPTITKDFYFAVMSNEEASGQLSTVQTVDHTGYVTVKMINYPGGSQSTASGNYHNMIQTNVLGATSKNGSVVYSDLLKKNLSSNGYPDVAYTGYTNHNLSELYTDCKDLSGNSVAETTVNHTFLASTYSETGYFEYDSTQNFAHLVVSEDDIWYGQPMPGGGTYGIGDFVVYNQLATSSDSYQNYRNHGQFFPFNDLATKVTVDEDGYITDFTPKYAYHNSQFNTHDIKGNPLSSLDPRYGEKLYSITNNQSTKKDPYIDHYFGMEMDANFMQSENGLDAWDHDLIFEFSGDDDFWLYVDGKLVLDLGGVHSACDGSVNFRTGDVNVNGRKTNLRALYKEAYLEEHPEASDTEVNDYLDGFFKDGGTVFKDYSGHTMKMFYMERGAGASNLHMRFNLAPYVNGEVQLEKEVSGSDTVSEAFPFQIWYKDTISGQYVQAKRGTETEPYAYDPSVLDLATSDPVPYQAEYSVNGVSYQGVYLLVPGQTASIRLPTEDTEYYFKECGINTNTYDQVSANGMVLDGTAVGSDDLKDYQIAEDTVSGRKKVIYNNHVSDSALKMLTVTKRLWRNYDMTDEIYSGTGADADNTEFHFRIYIGPGTDKMVDGVGYAVYNTGKYYVKNSADEYCIWQDGGFVSTGKTVFADLSTQKPAGEWKSEADKATFYTSPGGMADNIKTGYSIEIPDLMAGTLYYIEERAEETPSGYNLIGYTTTEGAYSAETQGTTENSGTIGAADENRTVSVHNQHGYGLAADKVWSDAPFMASHDDIYFGVYLNGELLDGSVRQLHYPATSINWFFPELAVNKTLNDYQVYELELTPNADGSISVDPDTGVVSGSYTVITKEENESINVGGISNEHGYSVSYSYTVSYDRQKLSPQDIANKVHSRTDTISNSRPGIKFVKTDLGGNPLAGAKFVLTDESGTVRKTFTSSEDGLIVVAYLENDKVYTLTETAAPYGYQTLVSSITIKKCVENGVTKVYVNNEYVNGAVTDTDGTELYKVVQVDDPTADNMPTITIRNKDYTLKAVKVDAYSNEPMKDVKFALYKEVYETIGGVPDHDYPMPDYNPMDGYESLTTDADGVIPGIFMKNYQTPGGLTAGTYYLREETPSGYNSLGSDIRITISDTGVVTLQSATRPAQSGHWTFGDVSESIATVAYSEGIMLITVKNTPKDPVRIKKLEMGTTDKVLEGVGFALYKIGQIGDDGLPRSGEESVKSDSTDKDGILLLGGLEENTSYYLYETQALPGYNMLTAPVVITTAGPNTINASLNGTPLNCQRVTDTNGNYVWEITVYNSTGYELPSTGGSGTNFIYFLGIMLTGIAGTGLVMRKRKAA